MKFYNILLAHLDTDPEYENVGLFLTSVQSVIRAMLPVFTSASHG